MSASPNENGPQKVRFFDWLVHQISSGAYEGLYWLDKNHTFRIPWKHNSRKNLVAEDYRIFKEWAIVGGKYKEGSSNPSRWKTNFRNALKSTRRFKLVSAMQDPDPHHVYEIIPLNTSPDAVPPVNSNSGSDPDDDQLHVSPYSEGLPAGPQPAPLPQELLLPQELEVTFGTLSLRNPGPAACMRDLYETVPHTDQNSCLPLANGVPNQPVEDSYYESMSISNVNSPSPTTLLLQYVQQNAIPGQDQFSHVGETLYKNNCFIENVFVNEEPQGNGVMSNVARNDSQMPANQQAIMEQNLFVPPTVPCPAEQPLPSAAPLQNNEGADFCPLDVSIYYRGKPMHETEVAVNSCMFTYNKPFQCGPDFGNPQIVQFPNPEELPDRKQVRHTLTLLDKAGLLLYEKNHKICAKRLDKCKVYWAFSKQLDSIGLHSQFKCLLRDTETEIFDYMQFWQELIDFHEHRRLTSPDYTIYLCFGQCFSAAKPKESKLILVKLVPKNCKAWHEFVLREGSSSLSSDMSLQISNSLMDLLEQCLMDFQEAPGVPCSWLAT